MSSSLHMNVYSVLLFAYNGLIFFYFYSSYKDLGHKNTIY